VYVHVCVWSFVLLQQSLSRFIRQYFHFVSPAPPFPLRLRSRRGKGQEEGERDHCNTLQHTATHCNTLQHTATHCNTLQHTATHCNTLQHTGTHCNTLQHIVGSENRDRGGIQWFSEPTSTPGPLLKININYEGCSGLSNPSKTSSGRGVEHRKNRNASTRKVVTSPK